MREQARTGARSLVLAVSAFAVSVAIWIPSFHLLFVPEIQQERGAGVSEQADEMAERYLQVWSDPALREQEHAFIQRSNPEWDFMGRTYLVLSLANMALREPTRESEHLAAIDTVIEDTLAQEQRDGMESFLMGYAGWRPFVQQPARSQFIDGEIALMLGARRLVAEREDFAALHRERVDLMVQRMEQTPTLSAESYPDECWTFCNTVALAAIQMSDSLGDGDHREFIDAWLTNAQAHLLDPQTGLLVSSYTLDGRHMDGPEGSSIFMAAHCLQLVDEPFASEQYIIARRELGLSYAGFGFAREWPESWSGPVDIDSGPTVPLLEANAGASGMALLGAAAFDDEQAMRELLTSLEAGAFPTERHGGKAYAASNHVGDAVVLYALTEGPLWQRARGEVEA